MKVLKVAGSEFLDEGDSGCVVHMAFVLLPFDVTPRV